MPHTVPCRGEARLARDRHCGTCRRRAAFTLIEVLATLLLVAIVLPVVMKAIALSTGAGAVAKYESQAAGLADAKLNELVATSQSAGGATSGDFGAAFPEYRWEAQSIERDVGLTEIQVRVIWPWRGQDRSVTVSTMVYRSTTQL